MGIIATVVDAILFLVVSIYIIISKRERTVSHYLFFLMSISLFLYSVVEILKFSQPYNIAFMMARIAPSFLSLALYFFILFTYYLRSGWKKDIAILLFIPVIFTMVLSYGYMVDGLRESIYGWVSMFNIPILGVYYVILFLYMLFGIGNLFILHRYVDPEFKKRILYLIGGSFTILFFSILYVLQIFEKEFLLPFLNLSFLILGIIYFYVLVAPS